MIRWLRDTLTDWWVWRDVNAHDISIGAAGDDCYLIVHTTRWFKRCVNVRCDRDELLELANMIHEQEEPE